MAEIEKGFGVIPEVEPIRVYDYDAVCGTSADGDVTYPVEYEIDRNLSTLKDQGSVGACVAEVIAQISEAFYHKEMSEGYIYGGYRSPEARGWGMSVLSALDFWRKLGTVPKQYFDYLDEMPKIREDVAKIPELANLAKQYPMKGYVSLNYANEKRDRCIKEALTGTANGYGLLAVSDKYFRESHCILITGWNDETDRYKIKNSWGTDWKDNGFGEIPKTAINQVYLILFDEPKLPFDDVSESAWYYDAVKQMYFAGMMKGVSDTKFDPEAPLTRAEMATLMDRFLKAMDERFSIFNGLLKLKTDK